jgi:hypothetical protein
VVIPGGGAPSPGSPAGGSWSGGRRRGPGRRCGVQPGRRALPLRADPPDLAHVFVGAEQELRRRARRRGLSARAWRGGWASWRVVDGGEPGGRRDARHGSCFGRSCAGIPKQLLRRSSRNTRSLERFGGGAAKNRGFARFAPRCARPLPALPPVGPVGARRIGEMAGAVASWRPAARSRWSWKTATARAQGAGDRRGGRRRWNRWQTSSARASSMAGRRAPGGPPSWPVGELRAGRRTARIRTGRSTAVGRWEAAGADGGGGRWSREGSRRRQKRAAAGVGLPLAVNG